VTTIVLRENCTIIPFLNVSTASYRHFVSAPRQSAFDYRLIRTLFMNGRVSANSLESFFSIIRLRFLRKQSLSFTRLNRSFGAARTARCAFEYFRSRNDESFLRRRLRKQRRNINETTRPITKTVGSSCITVFSARTRQPFTIHGYVNTGNNGNL